MGVLFTRGPVLARGGRRAALPAISSEGQGLIGPSAYLSPNTALILGQGDTLDRLETAMPDYLPGKVMLRRNPNRWPPLHSPLVWQRNIPNRDGGGAVPDRGRARTAPTPTVLSCVTGEAELRRDEQPRHS